MSLVEDGIVVHRGAIPQPDVAMFFNIANKAYELVEACRNGAEPTGHEADLIRHVAQGSIRWGGMHISHAFRIAGLYFSEATGSYRFITRRAEELLAELRKRKGAVFRDELSYFRRHNGDATHVPWHYDAGAAGTGNYEPCFNVWMPLVPVGESSPTLQFIPRTSKTTRRGRLPCYRPGYPNPELIPDKDWITPTMQPGDVAIFDHWTLHRTQPVSGNVRTSAEMRFSGGQSLRGWLGRLLKG